MAKPAFIVEGQQEQEIVRKICPGHRVVRLGVNGKSVTFAKIAETLRLRILSFNNLYHPIFVIFDREKRTESVQEIINNVCNELEKFPNFKIAQDLIFGIPDRKFEAWILPFIDSNGNLTENPTNEFEGTECKSELIRRLYKRGIKYNKTRDGVNLFPQINPNKLLQVSNSFSLFSERAKEHCKWYYHKS